MRFLKNIELFSYLDYLIRSHSTGSPGELAEKLGISKRTLFYYLADLKELGAPVKWNSVAETYTYEEDVKLTIIIGIEHLDKPYCPGPQNNMTNIPGRQEFYINH